MVSIQISLNGLSFYDTKQSKVWQNSTISIDQMVEEQTIKLRKLSNSVHITISTDNFVIIPTEVYLPQDTDLYFSAKLLPFDTQKYNYITTEVGGIIFIKALEIDLLSFFSTYFTTLHLTHPLELTLENTALKRGKKGIHLLQIDERCAISLISEGQLQFSDYFKIASTLDIAYYLKKIIADTNQHDITIYCLGTTRKHVAESLAPYFKKIDYTK